MMCLSKYDIDKLNECEYLVGIDEVGRGCLAGPLVVCGVIMRYDKIIEDINDSKKLSAKKREVLAWQIKENCYDYCIVEIDINEIDKMNIYQATKKAMHQVARTLKRDNTLILTDAMPLENERHLSIIKGDATSYCIACASILAKVHRDNLMIELAKEYPQYDLENNKGYGTKKHLKALEDHGYIDDIHRKTFEPIKSMNQKQLKLF